MKEEECVAWFVCLRSWLLTAGTSYIFTTHCRFTENNTDKTVAENYDCLTVKVTEIKETIKAAQGDFLT